MTKKIYIYEAQNMTIDPDNILLKGFVKGYSFREILSPHLTPPPLSFYHSPDNEPSDP